MSRYLALLPNEDASDAARVLHTFNLSSPAAVQDVDLFEAWQGQEKRASLLGFLGPKAAQGYLMDQLPLVYVYEWDEYLEKLSVLGWYMPGPVQMNVRVDGEEVFEESHARVRGRCRKGGIPAPRKALTGSDEDA